MVFRFIIVKKPRLVFDATAKYNGKSFNGFMVKAIGITAAKREMFHPVKLIPEDKSVQTILYRGMEGNKKNVINTE